MTRGKAFIAGNDAAADRRLPMSVDVWNQIAVSFGFSPQQKRIVACILRGFQDKEIAAELELGVPTVRTYIGRIFDRAGCADRLGLVLKLFAAAQAISETHPRDSLMSSLPMSSD
jgi:DNA-binding NarL/FixJ family response regulator